MAQRVKMDRENRAKQFAPFAALKGFEEALAEKEAMADKLAPDINIQDQSVVPAIASFNISGKMIPLYFAIDGIRIKVDNIKWIDDSHSWGAQYRCEITLSDHVEVIDLFYYNTLKMWTIRRK